MAFKAWDDHSDRWKREHTKAGETRSRWNRWLKLSAKTRKTSSITEYAKGITVPMQKRAKAIVNVKTRNQGIRVGGVHLNLKYIDLMTVKELNWTANASLAAIKNRARSNDLYMRPDANGIERNPWWYR